MLFIFFVDTGTMLSLEMNLALTDGITLKEAIRKITGIATDKQVLLASGGESLDDRARVCSYSAGTDTNPIYLYNKEAIENNQMPTATVENVSNSDLKEEVESSLNLPPTIGTVVHRCRLAQQIWERAKALCRVCEKLVYDQHLQHQGWAAVMANLEDVITDFCNRSVAFEFNYSRYLETRQNYFPIIESYTKILSVLDKIPILPGLKHDFASEKSSESCITSMTATDEGDNPDSLSLQNSLLQWIAEKDDDFSINELADHCKKGLIKLNESVFQDLKKDIDSTIKSAKHGEFREIKGLEDRLFGLDKLKIETIKILREQSDMAKAFHQNQQRASHIGDASILPDLCDSHKQQILTMHKNHNQLLDIKRRCIKAKQELVVNLNSRLKLVLYFEQRIKELEMKLFVYAQALKRIQCELSILQQLHHAPTIYMTAVAEVVRRRAFSEAFIKWANDLACQMCAIHSEEVARRENFNSQFDGHFLEKLFTGLEDMPPPFATQPPQLFDDNLPKLSIEDIETLKSQLPELALSISLPDTSSATQFFLSRSNIVKPEPSLPPASIEDKIVEAVTAAGLSSNLDPALLQPTDSSQSVTTTTQPISSDRGFESETDTEEFEKVTQSPCDTMGKDQAQKNCGQEDLFTEARKSSLLVGNSVSELKTDVGDFARWILCKKTELGSLIFKLKEAWEAQSLKLVEELSQKDKSIQELMEYKNKIEDDVRRLTQEGIKLRSELNMKSREVLKTAEQMSKSKALQSLPPRQAIRSISESQLGSVETVILSDSVKRLLSEKKSLESVRGQLMDSSRSDIYTDSGVVDKSLVLRSDFPRTSVSANSAKSAHNVSPSSSIVTIVSSASSLRDAATSPEPSSRKSRVSKEKLSESTNILIQQGKISVGSCSEGDIVLVIWDENFGTYTILQESSSYAYFLHLDSLCALGLRAHPRKQYVIGEVVNKEFCQAKKPENSYNVPVGSRFYRVKVRPLSLKPHVPYTVSTGVQST